MIGHELKDHLLSEISTETDTRKLRETARYFLDEKFSLRHNLKMRDLEAPSLLEKLTHSQEKKGQQLIQQIEARNRLLREISGRIFSLEEQQRQKAGVKWDNLKPVLEQADITVPKSFNLGMVDLSQIEERGASLKPVLEQHFPEASRHMNGLVKVAIECRKCLKGRIRRNIQRYGRCKSH